MKTVPDTRGFLQAGGRKLEYARWRGDGSRKPLLVLLHEGLGSVAMWKKFPARLAAHTGCDVFAYSRAGHGLSDPAVLPRTPGYMHPEALETLPQVLVTLDTDELVLIGHSDGASIALIHGGGVIDPRISRMAVMAPHVFIEDMCIAQIAEARVAYRTGELRGKLAKYHADVDHVFHGWNDIWLAPDFRRWNIEENLPRIRVPMLVVQGADDEYGTLAQVRAVTDQAGGPAQALIIPHCGHSPHRDQPEQTLAAIGGFLAP